MKRTSLSHPKLFSAALLLACLTLSSLSCTTITSLWASPTPTITPSPTITPTFTPDPTPEGLIFHDQRSGYLVILRYVGDDVRKSFTPVLQFLTAQGYSVTLSPGPSDVGDMDVILFGALSCGDAIDDLTLLLRGRLDISGLARMRFSTDDVSYNAKTIVIQIKSIGLFGAEY